MDDSESVRTEEPREKQTKKTLFIVFGFFLALGLLVALNMK